MSGQDNRVIAKNTFFLYIRLIFILLVSLYTTRVVLNALGIEDYGIYNVVAGFVSMFSFLNSSMASSTQRFFNYKKGTDGELGMIKVFNTSFVIQLVVLFVTAIVLESFGLWYINNKMVIPADRLLAAKVLFQFSVAHLLLVIMQVPFVGAIMANEKMDYYAFVGIVDVLLKLAIVVVLPYVHTDKLVFYGLFLVISGIICFAMYVIYARLMFSFIRLKKRYYTKQLFKEMISLTGWTTLDTFAYILKGQGLNVLLNAFCGPVVNAARGIAYQISNALSGFQANVITAFKPQLTQSVAQERNQRVNELMYSSSKISYVLLATFVVPIIAEIEYVLDLWLKGNVPDYTVGFTIIVLIDMTISSLNTPLSVTALAVGKIRNYQIVRNAITLCILPLSWIVMKMGASPIFVFVVSFIITLVVHIVSMILLHKIYYYSYIDYCRKVIFPCFAYTLLFPIIPFALKFLIFEGFVRLCVVTTASVFVSLAMAYFVVFEEKERKVINNFISKIKLNISTKA